MYEVSDKPIKIGSWVFDKEYSDYHKVVGITETHYVIMGYDMKLFYVRKITKEALYENFFVCDYSDENAINFINKLFTDLDELRAKTDLIQLDVDLSLNRDETINLF